MLCPCRLSQNRVDEVRTDEYTLWQKQMTTHITRLFDPPLTANGFQQASNRGHLLMEELAQIENEEDRPKCIYTSPTLRTLGTAMEIAKVIKLPIVVIPGLSACAAAVKRGKLIKEKVTAENNDEDEMAAAVAIYQLEEYGNPVEMAKRQKNVNVDADVVNEDEKANDSNVNGHNESTDDKDEIKENGVVPSENKPNDASKDKVLGFDEESDMKDGVENAKHPLLNTFKKTAEYELFLKSYGMFGKCEFLTKLEILEQFGKDGVQIFFDYQHIERFRVSLERLVSEADSKVVLCVTHREGIRNIDGRLMSTHIPYCALAKYGVVPQTSSIGLDTFDFLYYTD